MLSALHNRINTYVASFPGREPGYYYNNYNGSATDTCPKNKGQVHIL